jgi:two-component system, sensor histidine kinase YesM
MAYNGPVKRRGLPLRRKLFLGTAGISIILVLLVTFFAMRTTYDALHSQVIGVRHMSIGWLAERLELSLKEYADQFYTLEVDKETKADIQEWCRPGGTLNYAAQWRLITALNAIISMDANMNSIEIYNLQNGTVLTARRSGAVLSETGAKLTQWKARDMGLQTNMVLMRENGEIQLMHQINRFETNTPLALAVMRLKPAAFVDLMNNIRSNEDETLLTLNDAGQLVAATDEGTHLWDEAQIAKLAASLPESSNKESSYENSYLFYRPVSRGKLQIIQLVPGSVIASPLRQTLLFGILAAAFGLLGALGLSLLFTRIVSKPIMQLAEKMQHVTIREYSTKENGSIRTDEIGLLEDSFNLMIIRNQELIAQKFQTRIEKRSAQLRALQAQINPHFLYNTLQSIGGMALKKNAPEIYGVTVDLSDILRYSLSFSKEMVPLGEEIKYLDSYLAIQNQRFGSRIKVNRDIEPEWLSVLIPKLILQPIVENSLEHGLCEKPGTWEITLSAKAAGENDMQLIISDNGLGMAQDRLQYIREELAKGEENAIASSAHIGLNNVNSRIRLKYGAAYGVTVESEPKQGTTVFVLLRAVREGDTWPTQLS